MIKTIPFKLQGVLVSRNQLMVVFLVVPYLALISMGWSNYFVWKSLLSWLGLIGFIFLHLSPNRREKKRSVRYFYPAILMIILTFLLPVKTFLYFSIVCGVLLLAESLFSRGDYLPIFLFIVISPIFNYFITAFTFPIRLQLSYLASRFLFIIDPSIKQAGNVIQSAGNDFSVDPECMGLNMVGMGLLIGIMLLAYYQQRTQSTVSFFKSILFLSSLFALVIISNFFRILCLVHFNIPGGTWLHEMTGVLCFAMYVILPATFFIQRMSRKGKSGIEPPRSDSGIFSKEMIFKNFIVCTSLFVIMLHVQNVKEISKATGDLKAPELSGYSAEMVDRKIVKFENKHALIYVKHIMGFYSTEHSPMICWKGSGYELKKIQNELLAGRKVYTAELVKDKDILYTCWWFDNGSVQTADQLTWRWKSMRGSADFSIINVTTASRGQMENEAIAVLNNSSIKNILMNN